MDRALARALTACAGKKLYRDIGFVRLSDYVREILGISVRSAQEMMRTEKALADLPLTSLEWDVGALHREHVRLLSRVATRLTEPWWVAQARRLSVRDLAALVRASRESAAREETAAGDCGRSGVGDPGRDGEDPDGSAIVKGTVGADDGDSSGSNAEAGSGDTEEEDASVRVSFSAPLVVARRWRNILRFCRDVCGADLPDWGLVESLCADYLAGAPPAAEPGGSERGAEEGVAGGTGAGGMGAGETGAGGTGEGGTGAGWAVEVETGAGGTGVGETGADETGAGDTGAGETGDGRTRGMSVDDPTALCTSPSDAGAGPRDAWLPRELDAFLEDAPPTDPLALHERIVRLGELRGRIEAMISRRLYECAHRA